MSVLALTYPLNICRRSTSTLPTNFDEMPDCASLLGELRSKFATGSLNAVLNSGPKVSTFGQGNHQMQASDMKSSVFDAHEQYKCCTYREKDERQAFPKQKWVSV